MRTFFAILFGIFLLLIWQNISKVDFNIFSLFEIKLDHNNAQIIKNYQAQNYFFVLFENLEDKELLEEYLQSSGVVAKEEVELPDSSLLILALADKNVPEKLQNNYLDFFDQSIKQLFLLSKILPLNVDFFSLVQNLNFNFIGNFDLQNRVLKTQHFYLLNYYVKDNVSYKDILALTQKLKENIKGVYINSPMLYLAYAKKTSLEQSSLLGSISLILSLLFALFIFRNIKYFFILLIITFSLASGLCGALLVLENVHVLTLIISTSLVGLILDYSFHFLSANLNKVIEISSIKEVRKTLFTAFFITSLGYGIFLFSPMRFLHEIAIFSIFTLIGALFSSYFLFPRLLQGWYFANHISLNNVLDYYLKFCKFCLKIKKTLFVFFIVIILVGIYQISQKNINDNIKNYASISSDLLKDSSIFTKEIPEFLSAKFIIVDMQYTNDLIKTLQKEQIIDDAFYFSKFFNDEHSQKYIKNSLLAYRNDLNILQKYKEVGLNKEEVEKEFDKLEQTKILNQKEICQIISSKICKNFFIENKEVIYLQKVNFSNEFTKILNDFGAVYSDYEQDLNQSFTNIKINALLLKVCGFIVAFIILWLIYGINIANKIMVSILMVSIFSLCLFTILSIEIDIFIIFGLILGSAVGIDYMLFAFSKTLDIKRKILGIFTALLTSLFSFGALILSPTNAIFSFGISTSLSLLLFGIFASILASNEKN